MPLEKYDNMNRKTTFKSCVRFIFVFTTVMLLFRLMYPALPRLFLRMHSYPILTWVAIILILSFIHCIFLSDYSLSRKGYLIYVTCTIMAYIIMIGVVFIFILVIDIDVIRDSFPYLLYVPALLFSFGLVTLYVLVITRMLLLNPKWSKGVCTSKGFGQEC